MGARNRGFITPIALVVGAAVGLFALPKPQPTGPVVRTRTVGHVTAQERASTFMFPPGLAPSDRASILAAVVHARPEAQALIAAVDGFVDLRVGPIPGAAGTAQPLGDRFLVSLDLGMVWRAHGQRGVDVLVLHELGHVVDDALVGAELNAQLDATIPRGYGCDRGTSGACANQSERFAESFAKWATGDIYLNLRFGYKIPPPSDLTAWGAPLVGLGDA
jgi:hypothetical protein